MNKNLLCCLKLSLATPCNSDFHCRTKQSVVSILVLFFLWGGGVWVLTGSRENNGRKRQSKPKLKWHTQFFLWISLTNEFLEYSTEQWKFLTVLPELCCAKYSRNLIRFWFSSCNSIFSLYFSKWENRHFPWNHRMGWVEGTPKLLPFHPLLPLAQVAQSSILTGLEHLST